MVQIQVIRWYRMQCYDGTDSCATVVPIRRYCHRDGSIHVGRSVEEVGAHCKGHNTVSIGVCYIGGLSKDGKPKDTRTSEQKAALKALIEQLKEEYPEATVHGHNEFAAKDCPCFDVKEEFGE